MIRDPRLRRRCACFVAPVLSFVVFPRAAEAQAAGLHSVVEANATSLFGASSQTLTSLSAAFSSIGDGFNADVKLNFRYGESEDANQVRFVSSRGWVVAVSIDGTPKGRFTSFVSGSAEASLEKRIAERRSGGAGAKWMFAKSSTGAAVVSAGVLAERTAALSDTAIAATSVARWSWRAKLEQRVDERLSLSHETAYAPIVNAPEQYTVVSTSVGSYAVNKALALTLTFTDNYDSQARARGANTNNDGSVLFGVRAAF